MKPPHLPKFAPYMVATLIATVAGVLIYFLVRNALRIPLYPDDTSKRVELKYWFMFLIGFEYLYAMVAAWPFVEAAKRILNNSAKMNSGIWVCVGTIIGVLIATLLMLILMLVTGDFDAPRLVDYIALFSYGAGGGVAGAIYAHLSGLLPDRNSHRLTHE